MSTGKMITERTVKAKVVIPTKSRIAAWWMLIVGGIAGAIGLALFLGLLTGAIKAQDEIGLVIFIFSLVGIAIFIFYFIPGLLVLRGGRRGWIIASAILSLATVWSFSPLIFEHSFGLYLVPLITSLVPLILILSDHVSHKRGGDTNENHMP
jgi:hypothetical protein